jgi:glycosyltransferase
VARQTHPNIEHIIIDNCSTDATLEILKDFKHLATIISEPDTGIYNAMNKGIAHATGDIIGILNSDDYLAHQNTITHIVDAFNNSNAQAVYGNLVYVHNKNPEQIKRVWVAGGYDPQLFYAGWMLPHPTFYVRKEVYEQYGNYNESFKYAADYEMILRLALKHQIIIEPIRNVIVYMLAGGAGNKNLDTRVKVNIEDRRAWKEVGLTPKWYTLHLKPLRKLYQYIIHYISIKWLVHIPPAHATNSFLADPIKTAKLVDINIKKRGDVF